MSKALETPEYRAIIERLEATQYGTARWHQLVGELIIHVKAWGERK